MILTCQYRTLKCQYRILTCKYHIRTVSICPYLYVSARILVNASLLLLPAPICWPVFAGGAARGRCSSHAHRRAVAARSPRCRCCKIVARAAQAQANNQQIYLDWAAAAAGNLNSSDSASRWSALALWFASGLPRGDRETILMNKIKISLKICQV
jgi:hypothetical protein